MCENITRDETGELCFAGLPLSPLARTYGTPLYLYDEDRIRERCRTYREAMQKAFGDGGRVLYASKAASFRRLYEIMREEDLGVDVVSCGEICTANAAGFPLENAYFHSNNKTDADIVYAMEHGVGYFVVDNEEELYAIDRIGGERGIRQKVLLRLTPGIDPHTYAAVATGKVDSKFGSAIETGQAEAITDVALSLANVNLCGFHCHVGSQVFEADVFLRTANVMLTFVAHIYQTRGYLATQLDIGGGIGVRYTKEQPTPDIAACIAEIGAYIKERAHELSLPLPTILLEPGRSLVADAGLTLYTVGTVKHIPGYKTYVSVDGGMTDNPRFALYGAPYTILPVAAEAGDGATPCSVVGRCCESGDILQENVPLPPMRRGDLLACLTTGAYHYSMASNYNRIPRPPVVMIKNKTAQLVIRRETVEDLLHLEV
ncbi:MAG: diaminopimelate decarboxylase [Clostridiales bacterium]|nr:diaminopimelate decarboxylase [Clostridiales bacterium]